MNEKNKSGCWKAALYLRLSKEDGSLESASITAQRTMLRAYAQSQGFDIVDEYIDDGYSGTNFDRPAWQRLIGDVEAGYINLVLTKDLSRLGRDYILAGQYTELYFPSKGVRCIAVNDGYDSINPDSGLTPFQNVVNELYARDASRKIRSALQARMMQGAYIGHYAPFGYQKDPQCKHRLVPDPGSSRVVQQIFSMADSGSSPAQIANTLNREKRFPPSVYRYLKEGSPPPCGNGTWSSSMICKILKNEIYTGRLIQGKASRLSFKARQIRPNPRESWFIHEQAHEALVSPEVFHRIQARRIPRHAAHTKPNFQNRFSSLVFCADCGAGMSSARRKDGYHLVCGSYKRQGSRACQSHIIPYRILDEVISRELSQILSLSPREEQALFTQLSRALAPKSSSSAQNLPSSDPSERSGILCQLYEDVAKGHLSKLQFDRLYQLLCPQPQMSEGASSEHLSPSQGSSIPTFDPQNLFICLKARLCWDEELRAELIRLLAARMEIGQIQPPQPSAHSVSQRCVYIQYRF